ncbi:hypothetical protein [Devosia sp. 1566]|uniref:hypothetical protein n=1 Tax=Devosia sp. 1566 TaxID=2499144 RepID=UPI000FDBD19D|nr:hypothetical protein [Devosia sp. 1566]
MDQALHNTVDQIGDDRRDTAVAVAQFLALAKAANVTFDLVDDRLTMRAVKPKWALWAPIRHCLDEIGIEAIEEHFRKTTPQERESLGEVA